VKPAPNPRDRYNRRLFPLESSPCPSARTARRRTLAIISHPDAGKITITEKLLLFGGAIQLAGLVA